MKQPTARRFSPQHPSPYLPAGRRGAAAVTAGAASAGALHARVSEGDDAEDDLLRDELDELKAEIAELRAKGAGEPQVSMSPHDQPDPLHEPFVGAMTGWVAATGRGPTVVRVLVGRGLTTWIAALPRTQSAPFPLLHPSAAGYHRWYPRGRHALVEKRVRERAQRIQRELGDDARVEGHVHVLSAEDVALLALAEVE